MKNTKKNYYAIHFVGTTENVITPDWKECIALRVGRNNMYKGFMTKADAELWLKSITPMQERKHTERVEKAQALKNLKANTIRYSFCIERKLSDDLQSKMNALHLSLDSLLDNLLRDYLYGEE